MIKIHYPESREASDKEIIQWFNEALANNLISASHLYALSIESMAEALDSAGLIRIERAP